MISGIPQCFLSLSLSLSFSFTLSLSLSRLGRIGLGCSVKIFTTRLGLSVRISQIHFQTITLITLSLSPIGTWSCVKLQAECIVYCQDASLLNFILYSGVCKERVVSFFFGASTFRILNLIPYLAQLRSVQTVVIILVLSCFKEVVFLLL